ncbi:ATP-binding cassette domain-containing protein [Herbivorax sp. ANBcel31]|uniref:phosphonate C-P lyase system protein PhnL n=1 Tax=Herbivorax sp. ANBcel31 TaxID=3069754 RepID=UPI0027B1A217|nr:ATP-binding cassette domain-containing protein [Herbivorax sp. ANBcel31]MDQ2086755.1 ATP-binding cassette domain-containing protein [Herbivorax sp. ANBcel31]
MMNILKVNNLSKEFKLFNSNNKIKAIDNINLEINEGEFIGITGKSGSGKSTILKCIYSTYFPYEGEIWYNSKKYGFINLAFAKERQIIYLRKKEIGYVSQFLNLMPRTTAIESVMTSVKEMGCDNTVAKLRAETILEHFELDKNLWESYPNTFSGGEKLRLNIARAMVKQPRLLLLDEPTASLDNASKIKVKSLIKSLMSKGTTMIGIFHDIEFMKDLCTKEYKINEGKIIGQQIDMRFNKKITGF